MSSQDPAVLAEALRDPDGRIALPFAMSLLGKGASGHAVQVYVKGRKIGPMIIPDRATEQTLGDVLKMLGDMVERET